MRIPRPPTIAPLSQVSPTIYEILLVCRARAAWAAFGERGSVPEHPMALLGTCFHAVMEKAVAGELEDGEAGRDAARRAFDQAVRSRHERAHPLLRRKFPSPDKLPYYNLFRERAALLASEAAQRRTAPAAGGPSARPASDHAEVLVEAMLRSADGLLIGRPDRVNIEGAEVIDYKTGVASEGDGSKMSDSESRQLKLYVALALDAGIELVKGTIVRGDGQAMTMMISSGEAEAEAVRARQELAAFNEFASAGTTFYELAQPSPAGCRTCPCIPFCERFWEAAAPAWMEDCGTHVEGTVAAVSQSTVGNMTFLSLEVEVLRGTVGLGPASIEQVPQEWVTADGAEPPRVGDVVRVVNGRLLKHEGAPVVRVDRTMTAVWLDEGRAGADATRATGPRDA
jgi:RecB family exonuclease